MKGPHKNVYANVHSSVIHNCKPWKQPKCLSADGGIDKIWSIHTLQHYLIIKRNEALTLTTTWVNPENRMLGERSQTRKATWCGSIDTKCPEEQIHP